MRISLSKVEEKAPELVNAYKQTKISLSKHDNLRDHIARVALVLDISASMSGLFSSGLVDRLISKALPVGLSFDDDGEVDLFCFGVGAYELEGITLDNYKGAASRILNQHRLEPGTHYSKALELLEAKYADSIDPVFVIFVTDGETAEPDRVTTMIKRLSKLPLFLQFVGLGAQLLPEGFGKQASEAPKKQGFLSKLFGSSSQSTLSVRQASSGGFQYLQTLDEMSGRVVDNCNFFALKDPSNVEDEMLYDLLMNEYPSWVKDAKAKGILR